MYHIYHYIQIPSQQFEYNVTHTYTIKVNTNKQQSNKRKRKQKQKQQKTIAKRTTKTHTKKNEIQKFRILKLKNTRIATKPSFDVYIIAL